MAFPYSSGDVLTAADLNASSGLVFINTTTVGSAVSSVTVSNVFSSTFDNYRVIISKVDVSNNGANFLIKISGSTGATYNSAGVYMSYAGAGTATINYVNSSNGATIGFTSDNNDTNIIVDINEPYATNYTTFMAEHAGSTYCLDSKSVDKNAASSTGFTILPSSGTMTGGTIRVYGYNNG